MALSLRAVAVVAVPLFVLNCAQPFSEAPTAPSDEPGLDVVPHSGAAIDRNAFAGDQASCSSSDAWADLSLGIDEKGVPTRIVMKISGRDGTARYHGELIATVERITRLGEAEVRIGLARTFVPINFERPAGGGVARPAETIVVQGVTIGRQGDTGIVRLDTPVGRDFVTSCTPNEALEIGAVARKLIAMQQ